MIYNVSYIIIVELQKRVAEIGFMLYIYIFFFTGNIRNAHWKIN